ncbi:hypothetical protein PSY31_23235, partial [Shigella flexneri]|nr:hypothetical protein [Shigella flexneri]
MEDAEPVLMLDSEKFANSGSENGDGDLTISCTNPALHSKLPSEIASSFQPGYSVQEWPGESPISWNSHSQHPFS